MNNNNNSDNGDWKSLVVSWIGVVLLVAICSAGCLVGTFMVITAH